MYKHYSIVRMHKHYSIIVIQQCISVCIYLYCELRHFAWHNRLFDLHLTAKIKRANSLSSASRVGVHLGAERIPDIGTVCQSLVHSDVTQLGFNMDLAITPAPEY